MTRRLLVSLALLIAFDARARSAGEIERINTEIAITEALYRDWQYDAGIERAEKLYSEHPGLPPVQFVAGKAKFYRQDYAGAVALLERATAGRKDQGESHALLEQARAAREITREYQERRSKHFILRTPPGADEALLPYGLDALEAAWQRIGDDFDYHPTVPIVVEAYVSADDLSAVSGLPVSAIKNSGTIAICKHNKLMFTTPRSMLRGYEWLDTLSHEYVHYVVSRISDNSVPIWLHEGIAKYEETRWSGEAGHALSPYSEKLLFEAVHGKREFITFEQMHPSMALLPDQQSTALAFAEVFSAVEYIVQERGGYPALRKIVAAMKAGKNDEGAFEEALGIEFAVFERDWKAYLKRRPFRSSGSVQPEKLTFKEDVKGKVAESAKDEADASGSLRHPEAKRFAHLGELLRIRGRNVAAAREYEKAHSAAGPEATLLSNKLALTYMSLGEHDRAEKVLKAALTPNPTFVTTHVHLGRLYLMTDRPELAEAAFLRANEINPFDPEIHFSLYAIYKKGDKKSLAAREKGVIQSLRGTRWRRPGPVDEKIEGAGWLSIHSTPWAQVHLDGKDTGMTTPIFRHPLPQGSHVVRLVVERNDAEKTMSVEIEEGKEAALEVQF